MSDKPQLSELVGKARMLEQMTVIEAMRVILEGTDWLVESHSNRTDYKFAGFSLEPGSLLNQLEWLADSINCVVVAHSEYRSVVIVDNPAYGVPIAPDFPVDLPDIPPYPPFPPDSED